MSPTVERSEPISASLAFTRAVKQQEKLRLALDGVTGGGKTFTGLRIGTYFASQMGSRIALIDSERSSAKKYASDFDFDHLSLPDFDPRTYIAAIQLAIDNGYGIIIIDSLSHAWEGTLELKDNVAARSRTKDSFAAWREVTPVHNELVDVMLRAPAHIIATMRSKMEYLVERDEATGKNRISKVGLRPIQRDGVEYEFDIVGDMDIENNLIISKTRCSALTGKVFRRPGDEFASVVYDWLNDGEAPPPPPPLADSKVVAGLIGRLNELPPEIRKQAKADWVEKLGKPDTLLLSQLEEAEKLVDTWAPPIDAPASDAEGTA